MSSHNPAIHATALSILLVEDDAADAALFLELVREQPRKVSVSVAARLSDAVRLLRELRPEVVFLDMNLPDSAGLPTIIAIQTAALEIPIVVFTGLDDEETGMAAVKMGAQDYLVKGEADGKMLLRAAWYAVERKKLELQLKQANEKLGRLAATDPLTGIYNRLKFNAELDLEMDRARRYQVPLCLIMFDLDYFKRINDTHGHQAGDQVLKKIADLVSANIRSTDSFGRWGGEEFMVLVTHKNLEAAAYIAEKLRELVAAFAFGGDLHVTSSFGVTQLRPDDTLEVFTNRADEALYRAKQQGRNRVEVKDSH
jgi:diguanylate cyclase (GGDEF)-like protein